MALNHPTLGQMRGRISDDGKTVQYRGLKYARLPGRWQDPVLLNEPSSGNEDGKEFDATRHGPSCPQHPGGHAFDLSLVGNVALENENTETDELGCLNLVVTVPKGVDAEDGLPVFVWYIFLVCIVRLETDDWQGAWVCLRSHYEGSGSCQTEEDFQLEAVAGRSMVGLVQIGCS